MLPKADVSSFLPQFGNLGFSMALPKIHMPDLSFGRQGFLSGFRSFGAFFGGSREPNWNTSFRGGSYSSLFGNENVTLDWTKYFPNLYKTQVPGGSGSVGQATGGAAVLNQYDAAFQQAGAKYGIDPNWLKAVAMEEAGWTGTSGAGAMGLMQIMPGGYPAGEALYPKWQTDPVDNIMLGAFILDQKRKEQGGDLNRGTMAYLGSGVDPYTGISTDQYLESIQGYYKQLQENGGQAWGGGQPGTSKTVIDVATSFVGKVPYVWGGIPGKGANPTGWDCSGFTYWLDQNYGGGSLVMGSHYQFDQMQREGRLFTNMSELKPGDLIFFDTGNMEGAGSELNRAGHVAMYIGNGKIVHAANPSEGTTISTLSDYYASRFIGAAHMSWSG